MDIDQLKSNWQKQLDTAPTDESTDWENKMIAIEKQMASVEKNVKSRTLYGVIGFTLIIVSTTIGSYLQYLMVNSLLILIATISWIGVSVVTLIRLTLIKKRYVADNGILTLKDTLQNQLSKVEGEIDYYLTGVWKILAPLSVGFILISIEGQRISPNPADTLMLDIGTLVFFIFSCYFSYRYGKYYVAKNLTPVKQELMASLEELQE